MYFVSKMEKLISIHSLRMEGDHIFESVLCEISNFNPLPPHGGRLLDQCHAVRIIFISIHSLRMEGDAKPPAA